MAKARILTKHDYISVTAQFKDGQKLTMTYKRSGTKISGRVAQRHDLRRALDLMSDPKVVGTNKTYERQAMALRDRAELSDDISAFLEVR